MSDNTVLPAGAGGDTVRTIDRGTSKTQVVGLDVGGEAGPESLVTGANPLPVSVGNFPATQPVSGTVTSNQGGAPWSVSQAGVWSMSISNFPAIQPVSQSGSWTVLQGTTPWVSSISNFPVSGSGNLLADISIAGVDLGPALMETALPITLALDQDIPLRPTGSQPMAQSLAVTLSSDQPVLPIAFPAISLAPNAAQEAGGNLALLTVFNNYMTTLVELMRLLLMEQRAMNIQLASLTGATVSYPLDDSEHSTLQ